MMHFGMGYIKLLFVSAMPVVLALLAGLFACGEEHQAAEGMNGTDTGETSAVPVQVEQVESGEIAEVVTATGTVSALHDVLISSETAGTIAELHVQVGDEVNRGDLLVQVDPELKQLAMEQAEAALQQARAAYEKAEKDFERNEKLYDNKDISAHVFETARLQRDSAHAALLTARANLKIAERQLRDTGIRSPANGLVAARMVDIGSTVAAGSPVAKVVDISKVKIKFGVPERDVVKLEKGQAANIGVSALPGQTLNGEVTAVGPQADLATRTFPVEVLVANPDQKLRAGMIADVTVVTRARSAVPLLPRRALLERSGETLVFVVRNGIAEKRTPVLGLDKEEHVAVEKGISAGETVVVLGQENLVDGSRVEIQAQ